MRMVRQICEKCRLIRRKGRIRVICSNERRRVVVWASAGACGVGGEGRPGVDDRASEFQTESGGANADASTKDPNCQSDHKSDSDSDSKSDNKSESEAESDENSDEDSDPIRRWDSDLIRRWLKLMAKTICCLCQLIIIIACLGFTILRLWFNSLTRN